MDEQKWMDDDTASKAKEKVGLRACYLTTGGPFNI